VGERLRQALGLHSAYQLGAAVPSWLCHGTLQLGLGPVTEVGYNALHNRLGYGMTNTQNFTLQQRPAVRYSMQLCFRPSSLQWGQRVGWADRSFSDEWVEFVCRATPRQLQTFGFPPPTHPYWTPEALAGMALRYPKLDLTPWRTGSQP
jgi:hypothetical protein